MANEKTYKGIIAVLALIIVAVVAYNIGNNSGTGNVVAPTVNPGNNIPSGPVEVAINSNDPVLGDEDAPVTIVEFSDFECPFCGRFYTDAYQQIKQNYVDTGKVKFVYKHFPLTSIHPLAQPAAEASECAKEQGKFWEYHDMIFENQALLSKDNLKKWAADLGLDTAKFNECFDSGKYRSEVQKDASDGTKAGVQGTPAFFINGKLVSGAQPYAVFQQAIEAEL